MIARYCPLAIHQDKGTKRFSATNIGDPLTVQGLVIAGLGLTRVPTGRVFPLSAAKTVWDSRGPPGQEREPPMTQSRPTISAWVDCSTMAARDSNSGAGVH